VFISNLASRPFRINPKISFVNIGGSLSIECGSLGITKWTFHERTLAVWAIGLAENKNVLKLDNITPRTIGTYTCFGAFRKNSKLSFFVATSTLKVKGCLLL